MRLQSAWHWALADYRQKTIQVRIPENNPLRRCPLGESGVRISSVLANLQKRHVIMRKLLNSGETREHFTAIEH
jgi:uncharacterized protein (DUF2461 family)